MPQNPHALATVWNTEYRIMICSADMSGMMSGDIYEQAVVKTVAGFFRGNSKHLFGVTPSGRQ
jgi:hypothetical protein